MAEKNNPVHERIKENEAIKNNLAQIKNTIVVMSGKGGVGKTTVAVNLAMALSLNGFKVGLLDADITGPNVPKFFGIEDQPLRVEDQKLIPNLAGNVHIISMAQLLESKDTPIIWRGPLKTKAIQQFLSDVRWGVLDYLVIDLPPGTGDESLTVAQFISKPASVVIVTTPQEVALLDVRKSIQFAKKLKMPILGIIENMSGLTCPHCGKTIDVFRSGGGEKTAKEMNIPFLGKIPLDPAICERSDAGEPFVASTDKNRDVFLKIATYVTEEAKKLPAKEETQK